MFTVYKTTYIATGQYYYGKHETDIPNDDYLGSGIWIKRATKKHGRGAFRKDVLFVKDTEIDAFAEEVGLIATSKDDPLCMNFHEGGKGGFGYIRTHGLIPLVPKELITGRPTGSKNLVKLNTTYTLCIYECGKEANFLLGKKETPCCEDHQGKCSGYQSTKAAPTSKRFYNKKKVLCFYGCGVVAKFLVGVEKRPCCSETFYGCPNHWKNARDFQDPIIKQKTEATMLERYGVTNPNDSPELVAKRIRTFQERFGGNAPACDPGVRKKINETNQERYGGNAPAKDPEVAKKISCAKKNNYTSS